MDLNKALELDKVDKFESEYNGEKFTFYAKSKMLTPRILQKIQDWATHPIEQANALSEIITTWDIEMNGEPFPPTAENLAIVPREFLDYILEVIAESWSGKKQTPSE